MWMNIMQKRGLICVLNLNEKARRAQPELGGTGRD
jgi:hypothetical protein